MKKLHKLLIALSVLVTNPLTILAAAVPISPPTDPFLKSTTFSSLGNLLGAALNIAFYVGITISVIFLIVGGIQWAIASGDKMLAENARKTVINATIGFVIVIAVFAIKTLIQTLLGAAAVPILPTF